MKNELSFISLIEKALDSDSPRNELEKVFNEIITDLDTKQAGYEQFIHFMNEVLRQSKNGQISVDSNLDTKKAIEEFRNLYTELFEKDDNEESEYQLFLICNNQSFYTISNIASVGPVRIDHIKPGRYELQLSSGQIVWRKHLDESLLLNKEDSEEEFLKLAASTEIYSFEEDLLSGNINLKVIPGEKHGQMILSFILNSKYSHDK